MKLTLEQQYMLSVLHSQYHASWCSDDFRSQSISWQGIVPLSQNIPSPASEEINNNALLLLKWYTHLKCNAFDQNYYVDDLMRESVKSLRPSDALYMRQ